jgi:hypothetical protein
VVSVVLERILLWLLDSDDIGANNFLFTQKLRYYYILRSVYIVLIYLELVAYRFLTVCWLVGVLIY